MKSFRFLCLTLSLLLTIFTCAGCRSAGESESVFKIYLAETILSPEAECLYVVYENPTDREITYGTYCSFEKKIQKDQWEPVPFKDHLSFPALGLTLEEHDIQRQPFSLKLFKEPLTEGTYRIHIKAFDTYLEFEIREDGALPQLIYPDQESAPNMLSPKPLARSWQWYRILDYTRYYNSQGIAILDLQKGKNGLAAFGWLFTQEAGIPDENTLMYLNVVDRKTGRIYEAFESPSVRYTSLKTSEDGFTCIGENGETYRIILLGDQLQITKE